MNILLSIVVLYAFFYVAHGGYLIMKDKQEAWQKRKTKRRLTCDNKR